MAFGVGAITASGPRAISAWRACGLMLGLRGRRLLNIVSRGLSRKGEGQRAATPGKRRLSALISAALAPFILYQAHALSRQALDGAEAAVGKAALPAFVAAELLVLFLALVAEGVSLKNKDLARLDWDLEWLLSLPVSLSAAQLMKVVEQTVLNVFGWSTVFPLLTVYCFHQGLRWSAPLAGFVLAVNLLVLVGVSRVVLETAVRRYMPPVVVRNFQAASTLVAVAGMTLALAPSLVGSQALEGRGHFVWTGFAALGQWPTYLPTGLPARVVAAAGAPLPAFLHALAALILTTAITFFGLWWLLRAMVAGGVIEGGGSLRGTRARAAPRGGPSLRQRLSDSLCGIIGKDLHLLWRDRQMLIGTLVVPGVIIAMQLVFNPAVFNKGFTNERHLAAIAFGLGAYVLLFSAFSVLSSEGHALWLLFTLPQPIHWLLIRKALLWSALANIYTITVLLWGFWRLGFSWLYCSLAVYAVLAILLCGLAGAALGVFGARPLDPEPQRRVSMTQLYAFMFTTAIVAAGGFYAAPSNYERGVLLVILAFLTLSLWDRARDRLPYVLDPVARPPSRLTLADGMAAALLFFVLQTALLYAMLNAASGGAADMRAARGAQVISPIIAISFTVAGLVSVAAVLAVRAMRRTAGLWTDLGLTLGRGPLVAAKAIAVYGGAAALVAIAYSLLVARWPPLRELAHRAAQGQEELLDPAWGVVLALAAAPVFEELIFRGMIFRAMRKRHGVASAALASALLFAIVHPALSVAPVFLIGCCCAFALERSGTLLAPVAVHAAYNLAITVSQALWPL